MFSSEFCEIFKNTFFTEHLRWLLLYMSLNSVINKNINSIVGLVLI